MKVFINIGILLCFLSCTSDDLEGHVVKVIDGDTFDMKVGNETIRVRLFAIDSPERGQAFNVKAKEFVASLIAAKDVRVVVHSKDRYRRFVGDVYYDDVHVNAEIVKAGFAWHFKRYSDSAELDRLEQEARLARRGLRRNQIQRHHGISVGGRNSLRVRKPNPYLVPMFKKILRFVFWLLIICAGLLLLFLVVGVTPIDRDVDRKELYSSMIKQIDTLKSSAAGQKGFSIGFAKVNLTPPQRTATAGYGKRMGKLYESVHDSIYVRTMVIDNGAHRVAVVSADLLIIPPTVTILLEKELPEIGFTLGNTYLGAVHTHNSIGNWGEGATEILYGSYDDSIVHFITDKIKKSIQLASENMLPATLKAGAIPLKDAVRNRLIDDGPVDSLLRVIEVHRSDSSKLLLMSFTAHATCLSSRDLQLSRDYPGKLVDIMEASGYSFVMFLAGAVGSHTGKVPEKGWSCVDYLAEKISTGFLENKNQLVTVRDSTLEMHRVPLLLSDPQIKISKNLRLREWLFPMAFGDYPEDLSILRLGNIVMVGTPCDFSGEFDQSLDSLATSHGLQAMVTSFNGGYIGYVTPDKYYDEDHYETQLMNWYGPGNGEYINKCIEQLILTIAD